ncbi:preprotein translocase subunit SecG [Erythrobacter sp. THAF29]|uniref:preprotein translocase subunit SecG n=1 Tax=Erythrobacter sp. THAF29 TaxID=2587851 RepID=UPI0012694354|nr:preprotein translocase subunit SecG [Erythrobacter sp. THAF29]QFT77960.1 Protein-export membrane protein SecG [Erythrobacter sp. THAF29]
MFLFLTVLQAIVAAALVGVVLMQRSEGGGLGIGGNPNGALGARGAADFLTRATKWLAITFVALSIALAAVAVEQTNSGGVTTTLDRSVPAQSTDDLLGGAPPADPLADPASGDTPASAETPANDDPLAE